MKKPYEKPTIIDSQPLATRATVCCKGDDVCRTQGGPINS